MQIKWLVGYDFSDNEKADSAIAVDGNTLCTIILQLIAGAGSAVGGAI